MKQCTRKTQNRPKRVPGERKGERDLQAWNFFRRLQTCFYEALRYFLTKIERILTCSSFLTFLGLFAENNGHCHFCLKHPQRLKVVSLDALNSRAYNQQILYQLKMFWSPKVAKNSHFFNTLPHISAKANFWVFPNRSVFHRLPLISLGKKKYFQKLDIHGFSTIHHGPRSDIGKSSKSCPQHRGFSATIFLKYFCEKRSFLKWLFQMCVQPFLAIFSQEKSI